MDRSQRAEKARETRTSAAMPVNFDGGASSVSSGVKVTAARGSTQKQISEALESQTTKPKLRPNGFSFPGERRAESPSPLRTVSSDTHVGYSDRASEADIPERLDVSGKNTFLKAAALGQEDDFRALLEQRGGSSDGVNFKDYSQRTALMLCCIAGSSSSVQRLLDNKQTQLNCQDMTGSTALMLAAQRGHESIVELLLNRRADHRLRDMGGNTAIIQAARRNQVSCLKVMSYFITSTGDWTTTGGFNLTAEQWAVQNGRVEAADFIRQLIATLASQQQPGASNGDGSGGGSGDGSGGGGGSARNRKRPHEEASKSAAKEEEEGMDETDGAGADSGRTVSLLGAAPSPRQRVRPLEENAANGPAPLPLPLETPPPPPPPPMPPPPPPPVGGGGAPGGGGGLGGGGNQAPQGQPVGDPGSPRNRVTVSPEAYNVGDIRTAFLVSFLRVIDGPNQIGYRMDASKQVVNNLRGFLHALGFHQEVLEWQDQEELLQYIRENVQQVEPDTTAYALALADFGYLSHEQKKQLVSNRPELAGIPKLLVSQGRAPPGIDAYGNEADLHDDCLYLNSHQSQARECSGSAFSSELLRYFHVAPGDGAQAVEFTARLRQMIDEWQLEELPPVFDNFLTKMLRFPGN